MRCPFCASENTQVKDSRPVEDNTAIRRRRTCGDCGQRFTTHERVQFQELSVQKSDGRLQPFDRDKLKRSIMIAGRKRDLDEDRIDQALSGLVRQLEGSGNSQISSEEIGAKVLDMLASIDSVAFVRYASVYRDFQHPNDFGDLIKQLAAASDTSSDTGAS